MGDAGGPGNVPAPPRFLANFQRADEIEIKPVEWLIDGWIARDSLAGLVGPSGACKSFLAVDWACRIATETAWYGRSVKRGAVFYIAGEGQNGLRKRIEGWSRHNGVSIAKAPLYVAATLPPMIDLGNVSAVMAEVDVLIERAFWNLGAAEPGLIVIDTVARAMAGENENSAEAMGLLVQHMDELRQRWPGMSVLMVHHTGHTNGDRARGSSSFYAALDAEIVLASQGGDLITARATKAKDWCPAPPINLRRHSVDVLVPGMDEPTSTLVLVDAGPVERPVDRRDQVQALKAKGLGIRDIGKELGIGKSTVARLLNESPPVWEREFDGD